MNTTPVDLQECPCKLNISATTIIIVQKKSYFNLVPCINTYI